MCRWSTLTGSSGNRDGSRRRERSGVGASLSFLPLTVGPPNGNYGGTFDERFARGATITSTSSNCGPAVSMSRFIERLEPH